MTDERTCHRHCVMPASVALPFNTSCPALCIGARSTPFFERLWHPRLYKHCVMPALVTRKSGLPDLRQVFMRKSGKPDFRWHPRLYGFSATQDVDGRNKSGHDAAACGAAAAHPVATKTAIGHLNLTVAGGPHGRGRNCKGALRPRWCCVLAFVLASVLVFVFASVLVSAVRASAEAVSGAEFWPCRRCPLAGRCRFFCEIWIKCK